MPVHHRFCPTILDDMLDKYVNNVFIAVRLQRFSTLNHEKESLGFSRCYC